MDLGDGAEAVEFVEAEASLDGDAREQIAEAGLRCQGASGEVAACVTDAMREEFGDDVFESRTGPGLSADGQQRIGALITECSTGASEPGGPGAVEVDCGPYTRAIGAAWSEVAPASFAPTATALAVANALERSAPDAPPELAGDVAAIVEAARGNAEQVEQTFGDAMSEEARARSLQAGQSRGRRSDEGVDRLPASGRSSSARMVATSTRWSSPSAGAKPTWRKSSFDCLQSARVAEPGDNEGCDDLVDALRIGRI